MAIDFNVNNINRMEFHMQFYPYTVVNAWLMKYYLFNNTTKAKYIIKYRQNIT